MGAPRRAGLNSGREVGIRIAFTGSGNMTSPSDRPASAVDPKLLEILVCPLTKGPLEYDAEKQELISRSAKLAYPIRDGIPIMLPEEARRLEWFTVIARRAQHAEAISAAHSVWLRLLRFARNDAQREDHHENLGPHHVVERAEGDVGDRRDGPRARAHRHRRGGRQEQGGRVSGDEPERPRADARGGRRLPVVGVELDRALSRRQASGGGAR